MLKRLLYITKTSMTFRPLFRDQCRKLGMNRKGLQCSFGDKRDNVFYVHLPSSVVQMDKWTSFNVNLLQNLLFDQYKILFSLPTCVDMTLLLKKANHSLLLQKGKREQIKEKWKSLFFRPFLPIFCLVFSAIKLVTLFWLTYFNLFLTEAFTLYSRSGILPDLQS